MVASAALAAILACAGGAGGCGPRGRAPATPEPSRPAESAADHLRLAEGHHLAGRCGAAVFHYRMALDKLATPGLRKQVEGRIAECQQRAGFAPPRPVAPALAPWPGYPARPLAPRVRLPGGPFAAGSSPVERLAAARLCQLRLPKAPAARCAAVAAETALELAPAPGTVAPFLVDRTEVTWAAYQACVRAGACAAPPPPFAPPADARLPVTGVTRDEAARYCRHAGGRLPTEQEWERAGRGPGMPPRVFPFGHHADGGCARHGSAEGAPHAAGAAAVGTTPCDASPEGVLDLAGNVREWVRADGAAAGGSPALPAGRAPVRGGSFRLPEWAGRVAARALLPTGTRADDLGFRCVLPAR